MPIYEFECLKCGHQFERLQKLSDPPVSRCPQCGAKRISQLLSAPAIQFKGSGWYVTEYGKKSDSAMAKKGKPTEKESAGETKHGEPSKTPPESKTPSESKT